MKPRVIFLVGPTAVGKTKVAVELAKTKKFEIISCDSMQVYKGFKIISAQPSKSLRKTIPYHLVDEISPEKQYDVAKFKKAALRLIKDIHKRGKAPLVVGGSGLYISVLRDGIFESGKQSPVLRNFLKKQALIKGANYLYKQLKRADSKAAAKIHPHDLRRIIRALEVYKLNRRPISELQKERIPLSGDYDVRTFGIICQRPALYKNIDRRVEKMFRQGLLKEVRRLLKQNLSRTASFAIGIREIKGFLDGNYDLQEAKRLVKRNSRRYAKRQLAWFRKDRNIDWINADGLLPKTVARILLESI